MSDEHVEQQRAFYDERAHDHLQAQQGDFYAEKLAAELARRSGLGSQHRVLEVGAGFGRFTFPLLPRCGSLVALDLSSRALSELERTRDARGIDEARCRTLCAEISSVEATDAGFDFIVGFFILHHLPDVTKALEKLAELLAPGGKMAFLEPNRRNPLFVAQVVACPDMTWREEKGMFLMSPASVRRGLLQGGLLPLETEQLGFFPPQIYNRSAYARRLESRLEQARWLRPLLPFRLFRAESQRDAP